MTSFLRASIAGAALLEDAAVDECTETPSLHGLHRRCDHALVTAFRQWGLLYRDGFGAQLDERVAAVRAFAHTPRRVDIDWSAPRTQWGVAVRAGRFASPAARYLPEESRLALVEQWLPASMSTRTSVCLVLASTGEEGMLRRQLLAHFLAGHGISAVLLENPYYGRRRPRGQRGAALRTVADQFAMNFATVEEACALLRAFHEDGHDVGATGYSQGGVMAAFAAALSDFSMAAIPRGAPVAAAPILTEHAMRDSVNWQVLAREAGSLEAARARLIDALEQVRVDLHPPPRAPQRAILVGHRSDAFIPPEEVTRLHRHWRGSQLRWTDGGHLTGLLLHHRAHWRAILDAFAAR